MSGHSKWSTIKHQKQATDAARGQIFTKLGNAISIAVKEGGGNDPASNFRLRLAIEKAKEANMPRENITRAIDRASGRDASVQLHEVTYEGFGPGGVAIMVECVTDNVNRTASEVKNTFATHGGALGGVGSVAYLFVHVGELRFVKKIAYDQMLEQTILAGGDDVEEEEKDFVIFTKPRDLHLVKEAFEKNGLVPRAAQLTFKPHILMSLDSAETLRKTVELLSALEDLPDTHKVHANIKAVNSQ